jgi:PhoH-like ATPase
VIDTNVFLHNNSETVINGFADNTIIISGTVLEELDRHKTDGGEVGYNARHAAIELDKLRRNGNLLKGVKTKNGGKVMVEPDGVSAKNLPLGFSLEQADNRIISTCIYLNEKDPKHKVILVTNDILMRICATACGVNVQEYLNSIVEDSGYKGYCDLNVNDSFIDALYEKGYSELSSDLKEGLLENEFVTLHNGIQSAMSVFQNGRLQLIRNGQPVYGWVKPMNVLQTYAIWALRQPAEKIPLVILLGPAGSAKTFLSLGVGLDETYVAQDRSECPYYKMIIARPSQNAFRNEGFLPGDLDNKLHYLYQNFYDNIENLLIGDGKQKDSHSQIQMQMQDMIDEGAVEISSLSFIRGRSLKNVFLITDEAQNAGKTLIRDVITRAGENTKIVIAGDPDQIDIPTLDRHNNGLVYAAESMKGSPLCSIINFEGSENAVVRSRLARDSVMRMQMH